jgi:hypothetical protein
LLKRIGPIKSEARNSKFGNKYKIKNPNVPNRIGMGGVKIWIRIYWEK